MAQNVQENVRSWKSKLDITLHEKNALTDVLEKIEKKTGIRRLYIVLGLVVFVGLYLMIGYGAQFLCNLVGFVYPAYASIKAIESREKDDDTKWLTYWVVYSLFSLIEFFADMFFFWIPCVWFIKCVFLMFCMAPISQNGSLMIYFRIIRPFFLKHEKKMEEVMDKAADAAKDIVQIAEEHVIDAASDAMKRQNVASSKMD